MEKLTWHGEADLTRRSWPDLRKLAWSGEAGLEKLPWRSWPEQADPEKLTWRGGRSDVTKSHQYQTGGGATTSCKSSQVANRILKYYLGTTLSSIWQKPQCNVNTLSHICWWQEHWKYHHMHTLWTATSKKASFTRFLCVQSNMEHTKQRAIQL